MGWDTAQAPLDFDCAPLTCAGPCGAPAALLHRPLLVASRTATPPTLTFPASADHWTVTQGDGVPEGRVNVQPLISIVSDFSTAGLPPTFTFVFAEVMAALPPC